MMASDSKPLPAQSPESPPDHRSAVVNDGSQWWPTTVNGGGPPSTTVGPPPDHRSMVVDRQSMVGSNGGHVALPRGSQVVPRGNTWHHVAADVAVDVA
ncbi:hypothetical protein Tco_1116975 [Tanacetum coccineum]